MVICYFSATGNSLHAARSIAGRLGGCRLEAIRPGLESAAAADGDIGLVFPLHYFGLPPAVRRFAASLELQDARYVFAVVTCGSRYISAALHQLDGLLRVGGRGLDAGFIVPMVSSYIPLAAVPPAEKRRQALAGADAELGRIAGLIAARKRVGVPEYLRHLAQPLNFYWRTRLLPGAHRRFFLSPGCTGCGLCAQVCPADNIRLVDGQPGWGADCRECLACLHFCPGECIQFGRSPGRERYHHPAVNAADIVQGKERR